MAHELLLVLIPDTTPEERIEEVVNNLVRPHSDLDDPEKSNPRCDGWVIGGRYDGMIYGAQMEYSLTPEQFRERYGSCFEKVALQSNVRAVSQIDDSLLEKVNAFLLTDGTWTSCFDPRFRDPEFQNPMKGPKWKEFVEETLSSTPGRLAVVVDVHN